MKNEPQKPVIEPTAVEQLAKLELERIQRRKKFWSAFWDGLGVFGFWLAILSSLACFSFVTLTAFHDHKALLALQLESTDNFTMLARDRVQIAKNFKTIQESIDDAARLFDATRYRLNELDDLRSKLEHAVPPPTLGPVYIQTSNYCTNHLRTGYTQPKPMRKP